MSLNSNEIRKGNVILHNNHPCLVLSHALTKMGRAGNINKTKIKDLITGAIIPVTYYGNDKAETAEVKNQNIQFTYYDSVTAFFMNPESFEEVSVELENIPGGKDFLKEGEMYQGVFYEDRVISLILPKKMNLKVTTAPDATRGDSANNPTKEVEVETGYKLQVPLFIKEGEVISINTETGDYSGRES